MLHDVGILWVNVNHHEEMLWSAGHCPWRLKRHKQGTSPLITILIHLLTLNTVILRVWHTGKYWNIPEFMWYTPFSDTHRHKFEWKRQEHGKRLKL